MPLQLLNIPRSVYEGMLWHARALHPLECCGFLAGVVGEAGMGKVRLRYPLVNVAASPVEFEAEPESLFSAWNDIRRQGMKVLAVYHSHPASEPVPSRKDRERNGWPQAMSLIISLLTEPPAVQAWWLTEAEHRPALWQVEG